MAAPHQAQPQRAHEALAHRLLFEVAFALAWNRLQRYGLSEVDRQDVVQDVLIAAFLRRATYRADRGNLEQWLSGIVHREALAHLRKSGRCPAVDDAAVGTLSEAPTQEESVSLSELADFMFAFVPPEERRAVILYEFEGLTFREIADTERISPATAIARHARGMAKLRKMDEER